MTVVIVGGGIAGLAAAHRLHQLSPDTEIVLVESETHLGGKILTERVDGFLVEGGPDSFLSSKPRGLGLCLELGLQDRLEGPDERGRRTYVLHRGRLHPMPEGLTGLIPARLGPLARSGLLSPFGKLRLALDLILPARASDGDETLASFVRRRLGREVYARLVEPLMAGIYAGDGEQLSLAATFPQLRAAELGKGSLIRGVRTSRNASTTPSPGAQSWPAFLTLRGGMGELVEALVRKLDRVRIITGRCVCGVTRADQAYAVHLAGDETIQADAIILATPAFVAADFVAEIDPELAASLRSIRYVATATISLAYPLAEISRPLDGYGYLVPRQEGRPLLACTWTSTKFPDRAPAGYGLVRVFVGRAGQPDPLDRTDDELLTLARQELRDILGIIAEPLLHRIYRWPRAMPQYTLGHLERVAAIEKQLATHRGLFLAGGAYRGIGIPDCILSGETAAASALAHRLQMKEGPGAGPLWTNWRSRPDLNRRSPP